jgi:predicted phage tail protein
MERRRGPVILAWSGAGLLAVGYALLSAAGEAAWLPGHLVQGGRLLFYLGLGMMLIGVGAWLRQPPKPDPADEEVDDGETSPY